MKKWLIRLVTLAVVGAVGTGGWIWANRYRQTETTDVPVAQARAGEFVAIIRCRGELKAERSYQIYAPLAPNLRISWIAAPGEPVKQGDPIIRFDSSTVAQDIIQKEASLRQSQASYDAAETANLMTAERDEADLRDSNYQVEIAKLKTLGSEFVGRIQAEQARIDLEVTEQKKRVQEATNEQHRTAEKSKMASLKRSLDFAKLDLELTQSRRDGMEIKAPSDGYWIVGTNYNSGNSNGSPFKAGDNVSFGMVLGVIPDMASLMIDVRVEETDRGRISIGNDARVRVDAVPELTIDAKLTQISPLAEMSLEGQAGRSFRAYAALSTPDPRVRPGMNGGMDIVIQRIPDAISVPAKAIFTSAGKPVVYVQRGVTYAPVEVQILARNPDEVAISGIGADTKVALAEPKPEGKQK